MLVSRHFKLQEQTSMEMESKYKNFHLELASDTFVLIYRLAYACSWQGIVAWTITYMYWNAYVNETDYKHNRINKETQVHKFIKNCLNTNLYKQIAETITFQIEH